jgi:hypothetical protein
VASEEGLAEGVLAEERRGARRRGRLEQMALLAEIVGGIAVVISVMYLAVQISDNNKLLRSEAHYNALDLTQRPFELMVATSDLARIVFECDGQPFAVAESDWQRCKNYYLMQVNGWEYVYYQHRDGAVPVELWRGFEGYFSDQVGTKPGYARFWQETAIAYAEPFRSYAAEHLASNPGDGERSARSK